MLSMSDKKRKRGRPRTAPAISYGSEIKMRSNSNTRTIKKPKYLKEQEEENRSRGSTPARSIDNNSNHSKGSFNSRIKNSRGYNPGVDDKNSEYHFGSDFELDEDSDIEKAPNVTLESESISDLTTDAHDSELDELNDGYSESQGESGNVGSGFVPFWKLGPAGNLGYRSHTPIPVWLQDRNYPSLDLPKSSDDLLIPKPFALQAVGIYEVLRHFTNLVRLSPFHFEDFCAALLAEEQSVLLAEIHIALVKAIIREEEVQQTHFGLLDQKDSINIALYFVDSLTWAETLRQYLFCDPTFDSILEILNSCNYPNTSLKNRLKVLQFLCDQFLQTSVIRDFLLRDGKIRYDDHCRACHKTGDLLCCDSCSAVYHIECASPPLINPATEMDDWTCCVCNIHKLEGVTNCLSLMEASGLMGRQEPLGFDRHGRKYWFLVRRIFVESENGEVNYYSTLEQFDLIIALLDGVDLEESLFFAFKEFGDDIRRQMEITEKLTEKARGSKISQITIETEDSRLKIEELKSTKDVKPEPDSVGKIIDDKVKEEIKTEEDLSTTETVPVGAADTGNIVEIKEEDIKEEDIKEEVIENEELPSGKSNEAENKKTDEDKKELKWKIEDVKPIVYEDTVVEIMVKTKLKQLHCSINGLPYRLGCDNNFRNYSNQFVTNTLALNKIQHNEERDKKRHLAHKFSLSSNSEFKWCGSNYGSKESQITTVRQTLLSLEQNISQHFFHANWHSYRKLWNLAVGSSSSPKQFARVMLWLVAGIKPTVFTLLWHEGLGHIRLKRITALDREERKKQEKREKRESEEESKMYPFIKYTKPIKHQLWKMKGEEYRLHGLWGWQWLSAHRRCQQIPMSSVGLRFGPDKVTLAVKSSGNSIKALPISAESYKLLLAQNSSLRTSIFSPNQLKARIKEDNEEENTSNQKEILVANAGGQQRLEITNVDLEAHFEDGLINVSKALNSRSRFVYSKIGKGSTLDSLLTRRLSLKLQEEREMASRLSERKTVEVDTPIDVINDDSDSTLTDASDNENVEELPDSQRIAILAQGPTGNLLKEMRNYKLKYEALDKVDEFLPCYSSMCRGSGRSYCYSPSCLLKEKTKLKLINSVNNYKIVSSKQAPFDTVGSCSPIRLRGSDSLKSRKRDIIKPGSSASQSSLVSQTENLPHNDLKFSTEERLGATQEERIFSSECPSGKIYLKKAAIESKKNKKPSNKLPQLCNFKIPFKRKIESSTLADSSEHQYTIFSLPSYEIQLMARRAGRYNPNGFNPNAKSNHFTWVYPSSRPNFKITWLYRTVTMPNINAVAYQLRILWTCLRWEDMHEKGPSDGRKQVTTDMEIIQTEVLKRKYFGRFLEKTEYLRRKVTIPLDVPKTVREFTPSQRSGLRKRKRAHSPVNKQPESIEEWVDEEKLDLWEVRYFGERIEKAAQISKKALLADKENSVSVIHQSTSPADFKAKIEEQMKIQRANFNQKKIMESGQSPGIIKVAIGSASGLNIGTPKTVIGNKNLMGSSNVVSVGNKLPSIVPCRKIVTTKGGRIITVQTSNSTTSTNLVNIPQKFTIGKNSTVFPVSALPKVQVTSQGNKIIKVQNIPQGNQRAILPRTGIGNITPISTSMIRPITSNASVISSQMMTKSATNMPSIRPSATGTPIQLIRLPDGQLQVKGLQNGQQLIQKGDGKIHILSTKSAQQVNSAPNTPIQVSQQLKTLAGIRGVSSGGQIVKINGQQVILRTGGPNGKQLIGVNAGDVASAAALETKTDNTAVPNKTIPAIKSVKAPDGFSIKPLAPLPVNQPLPSLLKEKQLLQNLNEQPPSPVATSPVKSHTTTTTLTLRVQVRMTEQGPKTIIQGLQPGVGLTKDHILAIQQQVRHMLSQYNLQVNQLSPLMTLTLHITSKAPTPQSNPLADVNQVSNKTPTKLLTNNMKDPSVLDKPNILSTNGNTTIPDVGSATIPNKEESNMQNSLKPFVVTNDYIQQTIKSALTKSNLAPEVEEKLVQLQKFTNEKHKSDDEKEDYQEDEELAKGVKRQREKDENDFETVGTPRSKSKRMKSERPKKKESSSPPNSTSKGQLQDAKKKALKQQRLEAQLAKHKDLLKKDVLKKRALLEKELQIQIHKELAIAKKHHQHLEKIKPKPIDISPIAPSPKKKPDTVIPVSQSVSAPKETTLRSHVGKKNDSLATPIVVTSLPIAKTLKKSCASFSSKNKKGSKSSKNKKIVCICRTPFDDSKFYVGCDMCANWFHGDCVGITESLSHTLSEYVCDDCANAKLSKELFCFCKQPYDESQFYIYCERCEDWYHGKCIGIMQAEADDIDDYICPKCDPNNLWNRPCQKKLTARDNAEVKKVSKSLIQHKNAWPFLEPVDKSEVPDYYKVVKEPMDLKSIDAKVSKQKYENLSKFVADVMLVFDNCRAYNPSNSSFCSCAHTLELFFCQKLKQLKLKLSQKS